MMKRGYQIRFIGIVILFLHAQFQPELLANDNTRTRLIILADMGNEPDEEQQIVHMMMYNNEFDLEGLIAVSGAFLNSELSRPEKQRVYPELFHEIINAYEEEFPD